MEIYRGTDRTAVVGARYTAKIARLHPRKFLRDASHIREQDGVTGVLHSWKALTVDQHQSLKSYLMHGIVANRRERRLATPGGLIIPTRSLFGGLINIQPTVPVIELDHRTVHFTFLDQLGTRTNKIIHLLEHTDNFGVFDSQVRFIDGGSIGLEELMQKQPTSVERALGELTTLQALVNNE